LDPPEIHLIIINDWPPQRCLLYLRQVLILNGVLYACGQDDIALPKGVRGLCVRRCYKHNTPDGVPVLVARAKPRTRTEWRAVRRRSGFICV